MRIKVRYKITLLITAIIAVILSGIYVYLNNTLTEHAYQRLRSNLKRELNLAKIYFEQSQSLQGYDHMANTIGDSLNLRVSIFDDKGKVLGDSQLTQEEIQNVESRFYRSEVQQAIKTGEGESRRFSSTIKKDLLYMAMPFQKGSLNGIIRLAIPLSDIDDISKGLKEFLVVSLFIAFILSILFGFLASVLISNPIKEMLTISKAIASGDFSRRIMVSTNDEIEDLSKSINFMSEQIKSRIDEVMANKSRLEAVLLSMFEGLMVVDHNGEILLMNNTLKEFLQLQDDPVGKKPIEMIRNIEIQEMTDNILKRQSGVESKELTVLNPKERMLLVHGTPVIRDGQVDGAVLVFHDISELRRLEKIRQDFVANVSHELRTPIATIKGYAETLLDGAIDDKKNAIDFINIIHTDSERLANLINDLLDLSRIESGNLDLDLKAMALEPTVDKVLTILQRQLVKKQINVNKNFSKDLMNVRADEDCISQVFYNLIENAIKYNSVSGSIEISAVEEGDFVKISVADSGIGMAEEDLPRIFERFYRVDKARSRELGSTGLGLSIVKHIIQSHGGDVSVESELNKGTSFFFTLPKA